MKFFLILICLVYASLSTAQKRHDVVIHEIMVDPSPSQGLPPNEWLELRNVSQEDIDLAGWRISNTVTRSGPLPAYILKPDSCLILCATNSQNIMSSLGPAIGVTSFPSLDNDGALLHLSSDRGTTIHSLNYSASWYGNELKKQGGWTLEMIDPHNPCAGPLNWRASVDPRGGTPGVYNSIAAVNPDTSAPWITNAYLDHPSAVIIEFDEPLDSTAASLPTNYRITNGISIAAATALPPDFRKVVLLLDGNISPNILYTVTAIGIPDCRGNIINTGNDVLVGIPRLPGPHDIVINEILADPKPGEADWIELFNAGHVLVDVSRLYLANRSTTNLLNNPASVSSHPLYLFPGKYLAVARDTQSLKHSYFIRDERALLQLNDFPSLASEKGTIVLLNEQGGIVDEINYYEDWHFPLLPATEGVSLERIDPLAASQTPSNWHSAASTAGYGTPGYQNSQFKTGITAKSAIEINPKVFSPDNDGFDDILTINYAADEPGFVANLKVFNANGIAVKMLVRNELLGRQGHWTWDGLGEQRQQLSEGVYIILAELFNLQGNKASYKSAVILVKKRQ